MGCYCITCQSLVPDLKEYCFDLLNETNESISIFDNYMMESKPEIVHENIVPGYMSQNPKALQESWQYWNADDSSNRCVTRVPITLKFAITH